MTSSSSSSIQQPISEDAVQNLVQTLSYVSTKHQHVSATATQEIGIAMPHDSDMDLVLTSFSEQLVYEQIRSRLDICFHRKLSSSMMLFGDNEDARALLHRALHALSHDHETFRRVAIVKGQHTHSDAEGLLSISNQLLLRRQTDKELNAALEDLEQYFTQCRMDGIPAILIIEDFHVFAMRKRQMMIYTLLDFMHKRDLLFMMVGISPRADAYVRLEKRVLSRLNAQYFYLPSNSTSEMSRYLCYACTPHEHVCNPSDLQDIDTQYLKDYRQQVADLFGVFRIDRKKKFGDEDLLEEATAEEKIDEHTGDVIPPTAAADGSELEFVGFLHETVLSVEELIFSNKYVITTEKTGSAADYLTMQIDWARSRRYFKKVSSRMLLLLDPSQPYLTLPLLQRAFEEEEILLLPQLLVDLSSHELMLYSAIARLQCQQHDNSTRELTMDEVLTDFDKFTEVISKHTMNMRAVLKLLTQLVKYGLIELWNGQRGKAIHHSMVQTIVDSTTLITTTHSSHEIKAAFHMKYQESALPAAINWAYTTTTLPTLVLPERVRRAVLKPMEPLTYKIAPTSLASSSVVVPSAGEATVQRTHSSAAAAFLEKHQDKPVVVESKSTPSRAQKSSSRILSDSQVQQNEEEVMEKLTSKRTRTTPSKLTPKQAPGSQKSTPSKPQAQEVEEATEAVEKQSNEMPTSLPVPIGGEVWSMSAEL